MTDSKSLNALQYFARALSLIPPTARIAVLMRHAERGSFTKGHHGNDVLAHKLTPPRACRKIGKAVRPHVPADNNHPVTTGWLSPI